MTTAPELLPPRAAPPGADVVRLVSWNVHMFYRGNGQELNVAGVADVLRQLDADVVALQEVWHCEDPEARSGAGYTPGPGEESLIDLYPWYRSSSEPTGLLPLPRLAARLGMEFAFVDSYQGFGNAIMWRVRGGSGSGAGSGAGDGVVASAVPLPALYLPPPRPNARQLQTRMATGVTLHGKGGAPLLTVLCTHLDHIDEDVRLFQLDALLRFCARPGLGIPDEDKVQPCAQFVPANAYGDEEPAQGSRAAAATAAAEEEEGGGGGGAAAAAPPAAAAAAAAAAPGGLFGGEGGDDGDDDDRKANLAEALKDAAPHVIAGDFNSLRRGDYSDLVWEEDVVTVRQRGNWEPPRTDVTRTVEAAGYTDVFRQHLHETRPTCAFDTRIDYVFSSPTAVAQWRTVGGEVHHRIGFEWSDHSLLVTDFRFDGAARTKKPANAGATGAAAATTAAARVGVGAGAAGDD